MGLVNYSMLLVIGSTSLRFFCSSNVSLLFIYHLRVHLVPKLSHLPNETNLVAPMSTINSKPCHKFYVQHAKLLQTWCRQINNTWKSNLNYFLNIIKYVDQILPLRANCTNTIVTFEANLISTWPSSIMRLHIHSNNGGALICPQRGL